MSESSVHRIRYVSPSNQVVILEVPWPDGSGVIPPPTIGFFERGRTIQFGYAGNEDDPR